MGLTGRPYRVVYLNEEDIPRNPSRGEGHINMKAEIGGMHIQTRVLWEPLEAEKQAVPLEPSEEVSLSDTLV